MNYRHFYNYSLKFDDADCLSFLLYDYLQASRSSKFKCQSIKDFMFFMLQSSLYENVVQNLLFEAIYFLPRLEILYECNIKFDEYKDYEFGQFINKKRVLLFKLFNACSEDDFRSFALKFCTSCENGDTEKSIFDYLGYVMTLWQNDDSKLNKSVEYLIKYHSDSDIPDIVNRYRLYDDGKQDEIPIPNIVETSDICIALQKGDQSCAPQFLVNSESGPRTIDYDPRESYPYPESDKRKSVCLIFNICKYATRERRGADFDVELVNETFSRLHFTVMTFQDLTEKEMFDIVHNYSQMEKENAGSMFVCFIMAHGEKDHILDINENLVNIRDLSMNLSAKNCEAYRGKPKIFFIQSCQGDQYQEVFPAQTAAKSEFSVPQVDEEGLKRSKIKKYKTHNSTPAEADFIFGMSTVADCVSYRDIDSGSAYIHALCKCIKDEASRSHLVDILTKVTCDVSMRLYGKKYCQLPTYCSTARMKCYLTIPNNSHN